MIWIKYWIKNLFGFSRSQVNAFVVLLPLISVILFSEPVWHWWISTRIENSEQDQKKLDSLIAQWDVKKAFTEAGDEKPVITLFHFDPNIASSETFVTLGFAQSLAMRIVRYRERGGKFKIKSDLLKIYGMDSTFYERLSSFIQLPDEEVLQRKIGKKYVAKQVPEAERAPEKIDLNVADTAQLKKIYGIGDKLSLRIIKYRDVLGGFVDLKQLQEVYGLDSTVIKEIVKKADVQPGFQPLKININTASEKQLAAHPYLSKVARAIVSYRFQHGDFEAVEDIRNVSAVDEKTIQRIIPYLRVNDEF